MLLQNMIIFFHTILLLLLPHICSGIKLEIITQNPLNFSFQHQGLQLDQTKSVRPSVLGRSVFERLYFAKIGVGTFDAIPNFKTYYLIIDTGSSVIWVQCEECQKPRHHCFPQLNPPFPNSKSHSYIPLSSSCKPPNGLGKEKGKGRCVKDFGYGGGAQTRVEVASELFTFESSDKLSTETMKKKMYFGCGINQRGFEITKPGIMSGILGLGRDESSLQFQLDTGLNFSYCFPSVTKKGSPTTYLRFGKDIPTASNFQGTPLLTLPGDDGYYVKMIDIVVNGHRLHIDPSLFDIHGKHGGVFVDSGAAMSLVVKPVYDVLEQHLVDVFSATPEFRRRPVKNHTTIIPPLCYDIPKSKGYRNLPKIKFILQDAHFVVMPRQGFYVGREAHNHYFCLMMRPNHYGTAIGAYQHVNKRFVYDSSQSKLWFRSENCAKDI